tara:strand:+ start:855 stop:971 length:117 start_codon:yes stop_codon:yes gene_type:complete
LNHLFRNRFGALISAKFEWMNPLGLEAFLHGFFQQQGS